MGVVGRSIKVGTEWCDSKTYGQRAPICPVVGDPSHQSLFSRHLWVNVLALMRL